MNIRILVRTSLSLCIGLALCFLLIACSAGSTTGSAVTPTVTETAAHPTFPISIIKLPGSSQTILTDSRGFVLYFYIPDTPTQTACTGGCAEAWPPLLAPASGQVTSKDPLPGKLTVQHTANGDQVEYNKHLLYTYINDTPGQMTGNGVDEWYVATTDLQPPTS